MTLLIQPERRLLGTQGRPVSQREAALRPDLVGPLKQRKRIFEREAVESALILCGGNRTMAAERLEISREQMRRWVQTFRREDKLCASAE